LRLRLNIGRIPRLRRVSPVLCAQLDWFAQFAIQKIYDNSLSFVKAIECKSAYNCLANLLAARTAMTGDNGFVVTNDTQMAVSRPPRMTIQLPEHQMKLLNLWGRLNGRPATTFASQIVSSQIEANAPSIMEGIKIAARMEGVTEDEIIERWLGDSDSNSDS
jgi:hypothetical protein